MFDGFCAGPARLLAQLANCGFPLISSTCIVELYATARETERARSEVDIRLANGHPVQTLSVHCADMMHAIEKECCDRPDIRRQSNHPSFVDIRNIVSAYECMRDTAHKKQKVILILIAHTKKLPAASRRRSLERHVGRNSSPVLCFSVIGLICNPLSEHRRVVVFNGRTTPATYTDACKSRPDGHNYSPLIKRMMCRIGDGFILDGPTTMVVNAKAGDGTHVSSGYENCLNFIRQCVYYNGIDVSFVAELSTLLNDSCSIQRGEKGKPLRSRCDDHEDEYDDNDEEELWNVDNTPLQPVVINQRPMSQTDRKKDEYKVSLLSKCNNRKNPQSRTLDVSGVYSPRCYPKGDEQNILQYQDYRLAGPKKYNCDNYDNDDDDDDYDLNHYHYEDEDRDEDDDDVYEDSISDKHLYV